MQLMLGQDAAVTAWAAQMIDGLTQPTHAFGLIDGDGRLRGCLILNEITSHTADFIVYSEAPIAANIPRPFFRIVFEALGYGRLQTLCERNNARSRKDNPRWGFKWDGTARDFFGPGRDALRFVMLKTDCRYLKASERHTDGHVQQA